MTTINDGPNTPPPPPPGGYGGYNYGAPPPRKNKTLITILSIVAGVVVLCLVGVIILAVIGSHHANDNNNNEPKVPSTTQVTTVPTDGSTPTPTATETNGSAYSLEEQQYLTYIHKDSAFQNVKDSDIVTVGNDVCSEFRGGATAQNEVETLLSNKIPARQAAELIAGAVVYLCPDQASKVPTR